MKIKWNKVCVNTAIAIAILGSSAKVNAQYQIPEMYVPEDITQYQNGGMALQLCKNYLYLANIKRNDLVLQNLALFCQNVQFQYAQCLIQVGWQQNMRCQENASRHLPRLMKHVRYISNNRQR